VTEAVVFRLLHSFLLRSDLVWYVAVAV